MHATNKNLRHAVMVVPIQGMDEFVFEGNKGLCLKKAYGNSSVGDHIFEALDRRRLTAKFQLDDKMPGFRKSLE